MAGVLRIPCHDNNASFVLVHVERSVGGSSRPLDLTLVGTEGAAPYILTLKQNKVSLLKAKNGPCTQDEWTLILQSILLGGQVSDDHVDLLDGVETVASVQENKSIDITIRKRTEGITQRLGAFNLSYDENQEIELFEWCGIAVKSTSESANELASFKTRFQEQQETISKLNAQLEELIAAKANHETELLGKFRDLLNEKKAKIRDQQRLLATAKVDPQKLTALQTSRRSGKKSAAGPSRTGKRKADDIPQLDEDEDEDDKDSGIEKMDVDPDQVPNDSDQPDIETPNEDETDTADEDDDDIVPQNEPRASNGRQAGRAKSATANNNGSHKESGGKKSKQDQNKGDGHPRTPPRRELPFAKKKLPEVKPPDPEDEETASEDDEL